MHKVVITISMRISYPIEPIDINITDNGKFADMAYFFDRLDVMNDLYELRNKWIQNKLIPHNEIDDYINKYDDKTHWDNYLQGRKIAIKHNVGSTFVRPIISAVVSGKIDDTDYSTILEEKPIYNLPEYLQIDEKLIFPSSRIRETDFKNRKQRKDNKSISAVKTYRKWYWLYQKMGYRKIEKETGAILETIRSGVRAYKKALESYYPDVK